MLLVLLSQAPNPARSPESGLVLAGGLTPGLTRIKPRRGGGSNRGIRSARSGPAQVADDCLVIGGVEASHGCAGERGRLHDDPLPQLSRPEEDVVDALVDQLFGLDGGEGMRRGEGHRRRVAAAGGPCVDEDVLQWAQTGLLGRR
jgi:hypothetical protein